MIDRLARFTVALAILGMTAAAAGQEVRPPAGDFVSPPPVPPDLEAATTYDVDFFDEAPHDPDTPTIEDMFDFRVGDRPMNAGQVEWALTMWNNASDRTKLVEYARSHEDRPLFYIVISSPENIENLDRIKSGMQKLADPRGVEQAEIDRLVRELPGVAWMAYSIHGDEMSGCDAAMAAAYHLIAGTGDGVTSLLDELVIVIDPMMNPDGRMRYLQMLREARGALPNVDDQSIIHGGYWPFGRTNHYLFDLNRDWIFGVHPETRGRIAAVNAFRPLLFVDAHEMGAQDTYLFSPPREPINPAFPERRHHWSDVFSKDQAKAFDRHGWRYYSGEWNEGWYPGYSDAWAGFKGAVPILYEQAGVDFFGVRRPEGRVMTYREAVHHQYVSTMANLRTLHENHRTMRQDFARERRRAVAAGSPFARRSFVIVPDANGGRLGRFLDLMALQGFEIHRAARPFVASATDRFGRTHEQKEFPAGAYIIPNRQPEAHLLSTMLDFDVRMPMGFLEVERRELLKNGESKLYDITAWSIPLLYDLDAYEVEMPLPEDATRVAPRDRADVLVAPTREDVAIVIDGADDRTVAAAARLMERGVQVRAADRPFDFGGQAFARGSLLITHEDNGRLRGDIADHVNEVCNQLDLSPASVQTGQGAGDLPDLGGEHFILLRRPRIAIVTRGMVSPNNYGELWHQVDQRLGVPSSQIQADALNGADLRRYNVLIVPDSWRRWPIGESAEAIRKWVEAGGTLIAVGDSAAAATREDANLSRARLLPEALAELDEYELDVLREFAAKSVRVDTPRLFRHTVPEELDLPWQELPQRPSIEELKRRDEWQRLFMPQGAILAARTDQEHWLTFGCDEEMTALFLGGTVLMAKDGVDAPVRLGVIETVDDVADEAAPSRVGWAATPPGQAVRLRARGLLWPEAAHRLANAALVTRERLGRGQIILFAAPPAFRGATLGTARIYLNAVVFGPGMGGSPGITP